MLIYSIQYLNYDTFESSALYQFLFFLIGSLFLFIYPRRVGRLMMSLFASLWQRVPRQVITAIEHGRGKASVKPQWGLYSQSYLDWLRLIPIQTILEPKSITVSLSLLKIYRIIYSSISNFFIKKIINFTIKIKCIHFRNHKIKSKENV